MLNKAKSCLKILDFIFGPATIPTNNDVHDDVHDDDGDENAHDTLHDQTNDVMGHLN